MPNFFNRIHIKFIIASSLILILTLISFTVIFISHFGETITEITNAELARDLECEKKEAEMGHTESEVGHVESMEIGGGLNESAHDENKELLEMQEADDCHSDLASRVQEEKKIISAALLDIEKTAAWIALIAIILSSAVIYYISHQITQPITSLKKSAIEIGAGNLDTEIKISSNDEIGDLASVFKLMVADIKKAYITLQKEQAQLLASVNSLSLGFILTDMQGKIIITNDTLRGMFNTEKPTFEEINKYLDPIVSLPDYQQNEISNTNHFVQESTLEDKFIKIYISPVLLKQEQAQGKVIGSVILIEDITQQKLLENSKASFIAIAAHELKTPLSIIKGNVELLTEMPSQKISDPEVRTKLNAIEKNSTRLLKISNDFLDLTILEERRLHFNNEPFDAVKLMSEVVSDSIKKAEVKKLYLKFSPPQESLPKVIADIDKAREVINNILINSIQYTDTGGITIDIKKDHDFIKISITDTGIGIEAKDQKSLFQKFHTVKERFFTSKEYGSGMGLYISKLLIESMGGMVKLEKSDPKTGSVFAIYLPIKKALNQN